jgi:rare lipoprotein A
MKTLSTVFFFGTLLLWAVPSRAQTHSQTVQYGIASWYGSDGTPHKTASGEVFNENALTAANRNLPLGSRVKVTNLRNGRSVIVRITDRGPAIRSRVIDLSRAAAGRIGITHRGLAPVRVALLTRPHPQAGG